MDILNYYRKLDEKSRSFLTKFRRIDIFLCLALIVALAFLAINQIRGKIDEPKRINIIISPYSVALFGGDALNALIQEFEEQSPDLRILATDQEDADILFFDEGDFRRLAGDSALASLAPYNSTETLALPLVSFMDIFVYNVDILTAANLDRPPKTRVEFLAAARAVVENFPAYAFALGLNPADPLALRRDFYPWVWMNGPAASAAAAGGNAALPRAFADIVGFFGQLDREGLLAPDAFEASGEQRLEEFAKGKIAMITASSRDIPYLRQNAHGITLGITTVPSIALGQTRLGLSNIYAGISSSCALPDEAWSFLAFVAGRKHVLAEALEAVPGSSSGAFPGEYITDDPLYSKAWDIFEAAEIVEEYPDEEVDGAIMERLKEALLSP